MSICALADAGLSVEAGSLGGYSGWPTNGQAGLNRHSFTISGPFQIMRTRTQFLQSDAILGLAIRASVDATDVANAMLVSWLRKRRDAILILGTAPILEG